jgi:hypothetical protein
MFAEAFHLTIKDIHLALEVKTSFNNSMPGRASVWNLALRSLDFPLTAINGITRREGERERNLHTIVKSKA